MSGERERIKTEDIPWCTGCHSWHLAEHSEGGCDWDDRLQEVPSD